MLAIKETGYGADSYVQVYVEGVDAALVRTQKASGSVVRKGDRDYRGQSMTATASFGDCHFKTTGASRYRLSRSFPERRLSERVAASLMALCVDAAGADQSELVSFFGRPAASERNVIAVFLDLQ
jgi:hypothetical protein